MSINSLPDEIIGKIFTCLFDDTKSFINLASTSKRFGFISRTLTTSPLWIKNRPVGYNLYLNLDLYHPNICKEHGFCAENEYRNDFSCELKNNTKQNNGIRPSSALVRDSIQWPDICYGQICYYHRLFCLVNATHRNFSTLRFENARLSDRGCLKSFQDSLRFNRVVAEHNIRALVELELYECDITLDWLNTALNQLESIRYLSLNGVSFIDPIILVEPRFFASKVLRGLKITNDRAQRMSDAIFMYFLENFPAAEFDLSSSSVEFHKRIIQRFYNNANTADVYTTQPSDLILTFPMILLYLKKYQSIVKHFIANETNITFACLRKMLQDDELKHLKITVQNCPLITQLERARLMEQVESCDMARVTF